MSLCYVPAPLTTPYWHEPEREMRFLARYIFTGECFDRHPFDLYFGSKGLGFSVLTRRVERKNHGWFARYGDAPEDVIALYYPTCGTSFFNLQSSNAGLKVLAGTLSPISAAMVSTLGLQRCITPRGEAPDLLL